MANLIFVLEIIGTVAFAASGAMTAFKKNLDLLGVLILGLTTAVGGGILRDVLLGITPPTAFTNPVYALTALLVAFLLFLPHSDKFFKKIHLPIDIILFIMDTLGLGLFTVLGINTAHTVSGGTLNAFSLIFLGVLTGVGGGVLRDVMVGNTPYIFVKHFYASASILGAVTCVALMRFNVYSYIPLLVGMAVIIILRVLAAVFKWELPKHME